MPTNTKPTNRDIISAAEQGRPMPNNSGNNYNNRQEQEKLFKQFKPKDNKSK